MPLDQNCPNFLRSHVKSLCLRPGQCYGLCVTAWAFGDSSPSCKRSKSQKRSTLGVRPWKSVLKLMMASITAAFRLPQCVTCLGWAHSRFPCPVAPQQPLSSLCLQSQFLSYGLHFVHCSEIHF